MPRLIEIRGKTAAFVFGLGNTPTLRKLGVNLIAYAIAHHPQGKYYLKEAFGQAKQKTERIEKTPPIPKATPLDRAAEFGR